MGINKDKNYSIRNTKAAIQYENDIYSSFSEHDKEIIETVIKEVNSKGYFIEYTFQLCWIGEEDFTEVTPILINYASAFNSIRMRNAFYNYLGQKGNFEATDFLLHEFKKSVVETNITWDQTRRGASSSALLSIMDRHRINDYIELINNKDTRYDCFFIVILLGKLKVKKSIPLIIDLLDENNPKMQSAAIQALYYFKKDIFLEPILEKFLQSENEVIRENAERALKK